MQNPSSKSRIQEVFFERLKEKCSPSISFVDEVADVLEVSSDSAYRRLRSETAITLNEAVTLAGHFGIGIDEFISEESDMVMFGRSTFREKPEDFFDYLEKTTERFSVFASMKEKKGIYAAKDIPTFCYFQNLEFAEFKLYYWLHTIRANSLFQEDKFDFGLVPQDLMRKARMIAKYYFNIPFTELWSEDTVNVALRQIEYFHEAGWMQSTEVALKVCEGLEQIVRGVQKQAETELMWFDGKPVHPDVPYSLYFNDIAVMDNAIFLQTDKFAMSMIGYNAMDYLFTQHPGFCKEAERFLKKQISRSILISGAAEKERNKFFNKIYSKIAALKTRIQNS
jgi:hypothetical protein